MTTAINHAHSGSVSSDESFYSLQNSPNPNDDFSKPRTINLSPRFYSNKNNSRMFNKSPFMLSNNDSAATVSAATSIFERDVESNASIFTLSNTSINNLPSHHKSENFIPPVLNASVEALSSTDRSSYRNIDVVTSTNAKPSDKLSSVFATSSRASHSVVSSAAASPFARKTDSSPFRSNSIFSTNSPRSYRNNSNSVFNSPKRHNSLPSASIKRTTTNVSVEDLVRDRKNSTLSFFSYADFLEEEAIEREAEEPQLGNSVSLTPQNLFRNNSILDPNLMPSKTQSVSKTLFSNTNYSSNALSAPSLVKRSKSTASNCQGNAIGFYNHNNNSNISVIDEFKFKSMMVRKMSNLDDTLHEAIETTKTPKIPDSPTATPVALSQAYDPNSAISSPIKLEDDMALDFGSDEQLDDFEDVLDSVFAFGSEYKHAGSNINIISLEETFRRNQKEILIRK